MSVKRAKRWSKRERRVLSLDPATLSEGLFQQTKRKETRLESGSSHSERGLIPTDEMETRLESWSSHSEARAYSTVSRLGLNCPLENRGENASCNGWIYSARRPETSIINQASYGRKDALVPATLKCSCGTIAPRGSARAHSTASSWS